MLKGSKLHAAWYLARFYKMSYVKGVERNKNTHNIVDLRHLSLMLKESKVHSIYNDNKKIFLILDYNPSLPPIKEWIEELWPILYKSSATRILVDRIPIIGYRRPKNLQDLLVSSDLRERNWFGYKKKYSISRCN